jgi:hypothetical protein
LATQVPQHRIQDVAPVLASAPQTQVGVAGDPLVGQQTVDRNPVQGHEMQVG